MFDPRILEEMTRTMAALEKYMPLLTEILNRIPFEIVDGLTLKDRPNKSYVAILIEKKAKP